MTVMTLLNPGNRTLLRTEEEVDQDRRADGVDFKADQVQTDAEVGNHQAPSVSSQVLPERQCRRLQTGDSQHNGEGLLRQRAQPGQETEGVDVRPKEVSQVEIFLLFANRSSSNYSSHSVGHTLSHYLQYMFGLNSLHHLKYFQYG